MGTTRNLFGGGGREENVRNLFERKGGVGEGRGEKRKEGYDHLCPPLNPYLRPLRQHSF